MFLFSLFVVLSALAAEPNLKIDFEAARHSREFEQKGFPKKLEHAVWVPNKESEGLLAPAVPRQFRHLHAFLASAFLSKRKDQQDLSWQWLQSYECENAVACQEFLQQLDGMIKAHHSFAMPKSRRQAALALLEKVKAQTKKFEAALPARNGLCGPESERERWLELTYQAYCAPYPSAREESVCEGSQRTGNECLWQERLKFSLEKESHQIVMSSSYVDRVLHRGPHFCAPGGKWEAEVKCGVTNLVYLYGCERKGSEYPMEIVCRELKSK